MLTVEAGMSATAALATRPDARGRLAPGLGWSPFDRAALDDAVTARFAVQVRRHPERPAVRTVGGSWSYTQLAAQAHRIAQAILARRRSDGEEPVALLLRQGPELTAAILGTLGAGKIYVPIDPAHPETRNRSALADCDPALLQTLSAHHELARRWLPSDRILVLDRLGPDLPGDDPAVDLAPDRPACIFYTSGSTGHTPRASATAIATCSTTSCAIPKVFASAGATG